jgi:hypothetical protein
MPLPLFASYKRQAGEKFPRRRFGEFHSRGEVPNREKLCKTARRKRRQAKKFRYGLEAAPWPDERSWAEGVPSHGKISMGEIDLHRSGGARARR